MKLADNDTKIIMIKVLRRLHDWAMLHLPKSMHHTVRRMHYKASCKIRLDLQRMEEGAIIPHHNPLYIIAPDDTWMEAGDGYLRYCSEWRMLNWIMRSSRGSKAWETMDGDVMWGYIP